MVELRTLAYFVTACRAGSLALAAQELDIAVSTLSTTLKVLGQDFGVTLFRRSKNNLYPTAAARALMRGAEPLLMTEMFARLHVAALAKGPTETPRGRYRAQLYHRWNEQSRSGRNRQNGAGTPRTCLSTRSGKTRRTCRMSKPSPVTGKNLSAAHVTIALGDVGKSKQDTPLLADPWVFACRLPAGTHNLPSAAELIAGRLVVPLLAPPLIEQADRYFSRNRIAGVRFLNDHPGDLPRIIDDYPDAALVRAAKPDLGTAWPLQCRDRRARPAVGDEHHGPSRQTQPRSPTYSSVTSSGRWKTTMPRRPERPVVSLRQIHYFNLIHRLRRVSAAARAANISQPALSEQLQKMETSLGEALFERHGDGVVPTAKGDRFAVFSPLIEAGFRRLSAGDAETTMPQARRIVAGILPSVNQHGFLVNRITEAVVDVQARYPALKLVVQEAPNSTLQDWVIRGLVGVAIVEDRPAAHAPAPAWIIGKPCRDRPCRTPIIATRSRTSRGSIAAQAGAADQPLRLAPVTGECSR